MEVSEVYGDGWGAGTITYREGVNEGTKDTALKGSSIGDGDWWCYCAYSVDCHWGHCDPRGCEVERCWEGKVSWSSGGAELCWRRSWSQQKGLKRSCLMIPDVRGEWRRHVTGSSVSHLALQPNWWGSSCGLTAGRMGHRMSYSRHFMTIGINAMSG